MMIEQIKGAIFDMDGTLVDSLWQWEVIWKEFGDRFLNGATFRPSEEVDKAVRTMTLKDTMDYLHEVCQIGESGAQLLQITNELIKGFYENEVELKQGVREFLEYCKKSGIKMCVASATRLDFVRLAMKHCEIEHYFCDVLSCADIGKGKEEPDIFLLAQERLGTKTEETCVFEDSLVAICTAHKAGMKTVAIYDRYNYGQEEMQQIADVYIKEGETLEKLYL